MVHIKMLLGDTRTTGSKKSNMKRNKVAFLVMLEQIRLQQQNFFFMSFNKLLISLFIFRWDVMFFPSV